MVEENNLDKYYVPTKNDKCGNYTTWRRDNGIMLKRDARFHKTETGCKVKEK